MLLPSKSYFVPCISYFLSFDSSFANWSLYLTLLTRRYSDFALVMQSGVRSHFIVSIIKQHLKYSKNHHLMFNRKFFFLQALAKLSNQSCVFCLWIVLPFLQAVLLPLTLFFWVAAFYTWIYALTPPPHPTVSDTECWWEPWQWWLWGMRWFLQHAVTAELRLLAT